MNYLFSKRQLAILLAAMSLTGIASAAADFPEGGDLAAGAKTWADNCTRCHNLRSSNELRDDQWITSTFHMRIRAGLTGKQTRDVLTFLQVTNALGVQERIREDASALSESQQNNGQ